MSCVAGSDMSATPMPPSASVAATCPYGHPPACSHPRHRMSFNSTHEGLQCVSMHDDVAGYIRPALPRRARRRRLPPWDSEPAVWL